jgi:BNR repeat protein
MRSGWRWPAALAALLTVAGCETSQRQGEASLPPPRVISGPIAAPSACTTKGSSIGRPAEPSLAVDPMNPKLLIATWQERRTPQDLGNVVGVSQDGGGTWSRATLPGMLVCTGGVYTAATDPWVSIGSDGLVYVSSLMTRPGTAGPSEIVVSVSRDHGNSWDAPVVVRPAGAATQPDKETILADPRRPAAAYLVWVEYQVKPGIDPSVDQVFFARTTDGGRSWSPPTPIYGGTSEAQENQLLMTAGGVLVNVFIEGPSLPGTPHPPALPVKIRVMRSSNQGQTWAKPIDAASFTYTNATDPGTGAQLRFFGQNITAAVAGNAVYVGWFEVHNDFSSILIARSEDGGLKWRSPQVVVRQKPQSVLPTLAVAGDATVGVLWFDFRHFKQGNSSLDTDVWFSSSRDRGAHWRERHVAGPFDLRSAPSARIGPFIGDYMGLVGLPDGFGAAFVQAKPQSRNGPTDLFFSKIPS